MAFTTKLSEHGQPHEKTFDEVLDYLETNLEEYFFGGTISLYAYGIVDRKPKDIDVILTSKVFFDKFIAGQISTSKTEPESEDDNIFSLKISGITVDFIRMNSTFEELMMMDKKSKSPKNLFYNQFSYNGKYYDFLAPLSPIMAKKDYIDSAIEILKKGEELTEKRLNSLIKHINDVNSYNSIIIMEQIHSNLTNYLTF